MRFKCSKLGILGIWLVVVVVDDVGSSDGEVGGFIGCRLVKEFGFYFEVVGVIKEF